MGHPSEVNPLLYFVILHGPDGTLQLECRTLYDHRTD